MTKIWRIQSAAAEVRCIEDVIGYDGIDVFVDQALALGEGVRGKIDEKGAESFARLFIGDYTWGTGLQCDDRLRQVYLPMGYINVHLHDAVTGRRLVGIYDNGQQPVRANSVAMAIGIEECVFLGASVLSAEHRNSHIPGVLEIELRFSSDWGSSSYRGARRQDCRPGLRDAKPPLCRGRAARLRGR